MEIDPGFDIQVKLTPLGFTYGPDVFGPEPELRRLDAIRSSLLDPDCEGPNPVYAIAMDTGRFEDKSKIVGRNLLFGVVAYAAGSLGKEPVRSQGHVHKVSRRSGWSAPEIFEIWQGRAFIYMQEFDRDNPGRCLAIDAHPGERIVVPPAWAHAVISADPLHPLVFGAWCDRDYGFVYEGVRAHGGLAWFPILHESGSITWTANPRYRRRDLEFKSPRAYPELGLDPSIRLYPHIHQKPDGIEWVSQPKLREDVWLRFEP